MRLFSIIKVNQKVAFELFNIVELQKLWQFQQFWVQISNSKQTNPYIFPTYLYYRVRPYKVYTTSLVLIDKISELNSQYQITVQGCATRRIFLKVIIASTTYDQYEYIVSWNSLLYYEEEPSQYVDDSGNNLHNAICRR